MNGEDFTFVLLPGLDGEVVEVRVEEFDGAVASGGDELVFVDFGPGEVVERVLGVKTLGGGCVSVCDGCDA